MSSIFVNPAQMKKFANDLENLASEMTQRRKLMESRQKEAQRFWNDEKFHKFGQVHSDMMAKIQRLEDQCSQHASRLKIKAAKADKYLHR